VIVHDLDSVGVAIPPLKTNAPLVIDANTVLAVPVSFQVLQSVSRQRRERPQIRSRVSRSSFRRAWRSMALNRRTESRKKSRSVSAQRKERITAWRYTGVRWMSMSTVLLDHCHW